MRSILPSTRLHGFNCVALAFLSLGLVVASAENDVGKGSESKGGAPTTITVEVTYTAHVQEIPLDAESVNLWIPVPPTTDAQEVSRLQVDTTGHTTFVTDPKYGNRFAHIQLRSDSGKALATASYQITRQRRYALDGSERPKSPGAPVAGHYLAPSRLITWEGPVAEEAKRVAGGVQDPVERARRLYDNITQTFRYDKSVIGWGRGDSQFACDVRAGNCTDFHSLFIAEARCLGVPARFVMGFSVPADERAGTIGGYHCWAEFYTPELGWVPVDASDAYKHPERREALFGGLDADRIRITTGRDITLEGMRGDALNYAIYPYVEIDGRPHAAIETEYTFRGIK